MDLDLDKLQREIESAEQYLTAYRQSVGRGGVDGGGRQLASFQGSNAADSFVQHGGENMSETADEHSPKQLRIHVARSDVEEEDELVEQGSFNSSNGSDVDRSRPQRYQTEKDRERLISSLIAKHHRGRGEEKIDSRPTLSSATDSSPNIGSSDRSPQRSSPEKSGEDDELFFTVDMQGDLRRSHITPTDRSHHPMGSLHSESMREGRTPLLQQSDYEGDSLATTSMRATSHSNIRQPQRLKQHIHDGDFDGVNIGADDTIEEPARGPAERRHNNDARIAELQLGYKKALEAREEQRAERERQELQQYPYRPELSKGTLKKLAQKKKKEKLQQQQQQQQDRQCCHAQQQGDVSTGDRLYRYAEEQQQLRAQQRYAIAKANEAAYTFQPTINPATNQLVDSEEYKPIYDRVADMQREKQAKLYQLRASIEADNKDLTFAPQIDPTSAKLANNRRTQQTQQQVRSTGNGHGDDTGARLLAEAKRMNDRRNKAIAKYELELQAQHAQPGLSEGTRKILAEQPELAEEFLQRQERFAQQTKQKSHVRLQQEEQKHDAWFKPAIVQNTEKILQERRPALLHEDNEDRVRRLTYEYPARKQAEHQRRLQEEATKHTFQPELNGLSKVLAPNSSVEELNANRRGERHRRKAERQAQARHKQECTFKPQLVSRSWKSLAGARRAQQGEDLPLQTYPSLSINLAEPEQMSRDIALFYQEKEEKRRLAIAQQQVDELRGCTFTPAVTKYTPKATSPVVVRGLNRYLELQDSARNMKAQQKQREDEAFIIKVKTSNRSASGTTIPQPFKLSSGRPRSSRAVQELLEREKSNLTFEPETIEKSRRAITRALVESDEFLFYSPRTDQNSPSQFDYPSYSAQFEAALTQS